MNNEINNDIITLIDEEGNEKYYVADKDKRNDIIYLGALFVITTLAFSKFKGFKAMIALLLVVVFIYKVFIPGIIVGYSPILLSVITIFIAYTITEVFLVFLIGKCSFGIITLNLNSFFRIFLFINN